MDNNGKRKLDNSATSFRQSPRNYAAKDEIYFSRISLDVEKLKKNFCLIPKISCTIKDKKKPHHIINLRFSEVVKDHAKNKIKLINKENSNWAFFVIFSQSVIPMMMMHTAAF